MQNLNIDMESLKKLIKETVSEAIKEERLKLMEALLPYVDDDEMKDIIFHHGEKPADEDLTDMTDWVRNED